MRIAVFGGRGQLGAAVVQEASARHHHVEAPARADVDITDDAAVAAAIERLRPDAIVNCAAYNDVDGAEDDPVQALNVNAFAVRAIARAASAAAAILVHYSTDFVFDGGAEAPYAETDAPNPRSAYAASKLVGEWFALDAPRAYVLRVESLFGRAAGSRAAKGSVESIVQGFIAGREVRAFEDRTVSPTFVDDGARATLELIERGAPAGIYHCVNSGRCTWLELARELASQLGVDPRLVPVRVGDVSLRAQRPRYCALSNAKLASVGIAMPSWQAALSRYLQQIRREIAHQVPDRQ